MAQPFPNELKHLYENAEFKGSGGFAQVFRASRKDGRVVAVKKVMKIMRNITNLIFNFLFAITLLML